MTSSVLCNPLRTEGSLTDTLWWLVFFITHTSSSFQGESLNDSLHRTMNGVDIVGKHSAMSHLSKMLPTYFVRNSNIVPMLWFRCTIIPKKCWERLSKQTTSFIQQCEADVDVETYEDLYSRTRKTTHRSGEGRDLHRYKLWKLYYILCFSLRDSVYNMNKRIIFTRLGYCLYTKP